IMKNSAAADFVFGKDCRIQEDLSPVSESITRLDAEASHLSFVAVMFDVGFGCNIDSVRQPDLDLFCEIVIGPTEMHARIFIDYAGIDGPGRKNVSIGER